MTSPLTHPLVEAYLSRLEHAAAVLPARERVELLADIGEHLEAALAHIDREVPGADDQVASARAGRGSGRRGGRVAARGSRRSAGRP